MARSQLKIMAVLSGLVVFVVGVSGYLADRRLRQREMRQLEESMQQRAELARELVRGIPFDPRRAALLDAAADRAGAASRARVTLIAADGTVVGDSGVSLENLWSLENHADRPEVREALAGAVGRSTRRSATLERPLLYLAVPAEPEAGGVVRVAIDLARIDAAASELHGELLMAGVIGLGAALALSYGLAWMGLRPLRELRRVSASIAGGELDQRIRLRSLDELGDISSAINRMAEQLRLRLDEANSEKERLQAILNAMAEGVLALDAKGVIVLANDRMQEFYGVAGELRGRTPLEAIRDSELEEFLAEARSLDEPVSRSLSVRQPVERTLRVHAVRLPSGIAPRLGTVAVFRDITELTRLEQVRRDFVANASHELRTPLAAVRGFTETLLSRRDLSDADQRSYLEVIDRHSRRLSSLVSDLLDLSRIESREIELERQEVDVGALARDLLRDAAPRLAERSIEASLRVDDPARAWAEPRAVEQILSNLVDNAIKYTDQGGKIEIAAVPDAEQLRVSVTDTGIGIPRRDRDRIFERFYRVDKARSRELGGTGLGLSIVKHLVHSLGGEIRVESELGRGSIFSFSLARSRADPDRS